jgi:hypothetical protein
MIVEVKQKIKNQNTWYNESQGIRFFAWVNPILPGLYFVDNQLFIPGEDLIIIKEDGQTRISESQSSC